MRLVIILLALATGISCRKYAKYTSHSEDVHPAKKFNIVAQGRKEDNSMMVMMKGKDGDVGQNGSQGDPGLPGIRGPPGPAGLKGSPGVCTKEQCESDELKALIERVLLLEKYVKEKQNQIRAAATTTPAPPQGATTRPSQPLSPKAPVTSSPPAPAQGQPTSAPALPASQPPKAAVSTPVSSVPAPVQGQPAPAVAVPASSPQVLWGSPSPPPVSPPLPSPFGGFTIESTLEAPGTILGGNGQVDIQGVVTPQVSVTQGYSGNPGTLPGMQRGIPFKKSSILPKGPATKLHHVPKKSAHHSAVHHKTRTQKS